MLSDQDVTDLVQLRRELHRFPEVSGQEEKTAARIQAALRPLRADQLITGLGGHGLAAVFDSGKAGQTLLFRCELDALPIAERSAVPHRSEHAGKGHLCGHDGHMAIIMALARLLARNRPANGRVILMFQPAEEDGSGAAAVIADPRFATLHPDWAFALHNMPGAELGACWLATGAVNCASVGMKLKLDGKTSHAAQPERGLSPGLTLASLIPSLSALGQGGALGPEYCLVTVTHAVLGEAAFGIAPGQAELWLTLRALLDPAMVALKAKATAQAEAAARAAGLSLCISFHDDFAASVNDPQACQQLTKALQDLNLPHEHGDLPMRASEDFGRFSAVPGTKGAMLFLGAGKTHPALHNPDYDFPDQLIPTGAAIFDRVTRQILG